MPKYQLKVLSSEEFDQVAKSDPRYSYVDETNMGFADREKNIAYVRHTHMHDLNKYLIDHELEELEMDESTHEDPNGIRHKKFMDFIKGIFGAPFRAAGAALGGFQPKQEQPQFESPQPMSGSYTASGGQSPMGLFQPGESTSGSYTAGSQIPSSAAGFGSLGGGLSDETRKSLQAGNYAGRLTF